MEKHGLSASNCKEMVVMSLDDTSRLILVLRIKRTKNKKTQKNSRQKYLHKF